MPDGSAVFARLTPEQAVAARQEGPVVVLAGAGTGKTSTLVAGVCDRVLRRNIPPRRILAVTFTNKAAREMRERIALALGYDLLPSWIGTFHAHGCRQIRRDPGIAELRKGFEILSSDDTLRILRRLLKHRMNTTDAAIEESGSGDAFRKRVRRIANHISTLKENLVLPEEAWTRKTAEKPETEDEYVFFQALALYPAYQAALREANAADYADLLLFPTRTMMADEAYRREWAGRFDALMVDEYQDVNRVQYTWLRLLARDHGEFFVVGDDAQSIYGWRGANIGYIRNFLADFPDGKMIPLERNFRSTGHILDAANAIIALDPNRIPKRLYTTVGQGNPIEIVACRNAWSEGKMIAHEIGRMAAQGHLYHHSAILYRYNYLSRGIEEELLRQQIPYVLVGDTGFWQRGAVKDALSFLRLAERPDDRQSDEAFRRVVNVPARGVGAKSLAKIEIAAQEQGVALFVAAEQMCATAPRLHAFLGLLRDLQRDRDLTLGECIETALRETGYFEMLRAAGDEGRDALANLNELIGISANFAVSDELFEHAALGAGAPGDGLDGRVRLMTMHAAKGLEFDTVFLIGWEQGLFPQSGDAVDSDEERRLAYVGITRARRREIISWCAKRGNMPAARSPFLDELPAGCFVDGLLGHPALT
ncbi:MAG: UvrD-helicase domain-containing protein [Gluconacetobacter sp.]